jgi:FtsP/CotA-like multicopper oxidase with cupredoxin domain
MSTATLVVLDLAAALVAAALWVSAGALTAQGRSRVAAGLAAGAAVATCGRVATAVALAGRGWWFAQEKLTVAVPLLLVAAATVVPTVRRGGAAAATAMLTAGYAAAVGLALTLLAGYPSGWGAGLVCAAVVGAAALVTRRALAPAPAPGTLRTGVAAVLAVGLAGGALSVALPGAPTDGGGGVADAAPPGGRTVSVDELRGPDTPDPGGQVRRHTLTARQATVTLSSGRTVAAWTFDGRVPGPPLTATVGDLVEVTLRNADIGQGVTLHWHGYDVPAADDGAPGLTQDAVPPGGSFVYRFRAEQAGAYWYHTHQVSDRGVRMGLYGTLIVSPRAPSTVGSVDIALPVHTLDGTLILGDRDTAQERRVAPGTPVRLRLVNTDSGPHRFALAGVPYRLAAVDGTDLNRPGELTEATLRLAAGGRYDLAFTMPAGAVTLVVDGTTGAGLRLAPDGVPFARTGPEVAGWPEVDLAAYGAPAATPFGAGSRFDRHFTLVLDRGLALVGRLPTYAYTVDGKAFPSVPTQVVRAGDLVEMAVVNRGFATHPWHLHGHHVLVLARNGRAAVGSPLWMDTFDVRPGEVWVVAFRADNPGVWMNHCHNLSHAGQGMALHLEYDGVTTPFHGGHGAG